MGQSAGENLGLDNITFARKAEAFGKDRERPPQGHPGHDFVAWQVRMLMHDIAALGMLIRLPPSLHDLQRRPPRAIEKVVEEREGKEFCCTHSTESSPRVNACSSNTPAMYPRKLSYLPVQAQSSPSGPICIRGHCLGFTLLD